MVPFPSEGEVIFSLGGSPAPREGRGVFIPLDDVPSTSSWNQDDDLTVVTVVPLTKVRKKLERTFSEKFLLSPPLSFLAGQIPRRAGVPSPKLLLKSNG